MSLIDKYEHARDAALQRLGIAVAASHRAAEDVRRIAYKLGIPTSGC